LKSEALPPSGDSDAGLYIHVPFCTSVCPYCDFAVLIAGEERRSLWAASVVREAGMYTRCGLVFDTVYLGGGTPSSVAPGRFGEVLAGVRRHLEIAAEAQVFLEANPEDVTHAAVEAWKILGVQTVTLGVQSFDNEALRFLGRRHTAVELAFPDRRGGRPRGATSLVLSADHSQGHGVRATARAGAHQRASYRHPG